MATKKQPARGGSAKKPAAPTRKPAAARTAAAKPAVVKSTGPAPAPAAPKRSNRNVILFGVLAIVALSGLQFFLLMTVGDDAALQPVDPRLEYRLQVTRVLDLSLPYLAEDRYQKFLDGLQKEIRERLGFKVVFLQRRTLLLENFVSPDETFFDTQMSKDFLRRVQANDGSRPLEYAWIRAMLADPHDRALLAARFGKADDAELEKRVRGDFARRQARMHEIRNQRGALLYPAGRRAPQASSGPGWYVLANQNTSDFVIANSPVFLPSANLPADAATRGGLVTTMLAGSLRPFGGTLALSVYPVYADRRLSENDRLRAMTELALQGFAQLLYRRPLSMEKTSSLLFPVLGDDIAGWLKGPRRTLLDGNYKPVLTKF